MRREAEGAFPAASKDLAQPSTMTRRPEHLTTLEVELDAQFEIAGLQHRISSQPCRTVRFPEAVQDYGERCNPPGDFHQRDGGPFGDGVETSRTSVELKCDQFDHCRV